MLQLAGGYFRDCEKTREVELSQDQRQQIQSCLNQRGFDLGSADGMFGPRTRAAIRDWQETREGGKATGFLSRDDADTLLAACKVALEPICTSEAGPPCWIEFANRPGCYRWNPNPAPEETVTWSGGCLDGKPSGKGKEVWLFRKEGWWQTSSGKGEMRDGKAHGHWINRESDGDVSEGPYVDGKRHGHWITRESDGAVWEGPYVDGKWSGLWVKRGSGSGELVMNCGTNGKRVDRSYCVVETAVEEMEVTGRAQLRHGPGKAYGAKGTALDLGDKVKVSSKAGEWLWVEAADGRRGFVQTSMLGEVPEPAAVAVVTEPKCSFDDDSTRECWHETYNKPGCYFFVFDNEDIRWEDGSGRYEQRWSGSCSGGVATGKGALTSYLLADMPLEQIWIGEFLNGKRHGHWILKKLNELNDEPANLIEDQGNYTLGRKDGVWRETRGWIDFGVDAVRKRKGATVCINEIKYSVDADPEIVKRSRCGDGGHERAMFE